MAQTINADDGVISGSAGLKSSSDGTAILSLQTKGTTALTVDGSQNVGLGVTPSAWDSGKAIEVNQLGTAFWGNGVNNLWITSNAYYNGGNFKYGTGGGNLANAYQMVVGQHRWYLGPAGTNAGDTISFTQAMTLDASGQLGIGTTSPGALLHTYTATQESVRFARNSTNSSAYVTFYANNSSSAQVQYAGILGDVASSTAGSHGGNLLFYTTGSGTSAERARITSGGDLLVGTTTAKERLTVQGRGHFTTELDTSVTVESTDGTTGLTFKDPDGESYFIYVGASNTFSTFGSSNLSVGGALSKGSGSFRIDHPLKPDTHHLVHSFIEGPQADLIYRGKVALVDGQATVNIDEAAGMTEGTFVALCREVQCFTSNESDWDAVRGSVSGNILIIECQNQNSTATISWMVVGERQDKHMYDTNWTDENGKVIVEPEKPEAK